MCHEINRWAPLLCVVTPSHCGQLLTECTTPTCSVCLLPGGCMSREGTRSSIPNEASREAPNYCHWREGEGGKAGRRGRSSDDGEGRVQCIRTHVRTYMYQVNKGAYMHRTHVRTMALYCTRCICTYMYRTCTHTHKHIHTYILTYTHIHTCTYAHTHIRMYTPSLVHQPLPSPC